MVLAMGGRAVNPHISLSPEIYEYTEIQIPHENTFIGKKIIWGSVPVFNQDKIWTGFFPALELLFTPITEEMLY